MRAELVVIGAGPAGMAASLAAADLGCQVVLVDAGRQLGGQIHRQPGLPDAGQDDPDDATDALPARFRRVAAHPRIRRLRAVTVWHIDRDSGDFRLDLVETAVRSPDRPPPPSAVAASAVVVATGATELALPFPGWDLPGVMTAGAAQALVKGDGVRPGGRVVVAGSGPFLLPVAATLAANGTKVVAVVEANRQRDLLPLAPALARHPSKLREAAGYLATLARHRIPLRTGQAVVAAEGDSVVERIRIARLDRAWRPLAGEPEELRVDAVCVTYGFVPALDMTRALGCEDMVYGERPYAAALADHQLASSVPGVFLAGEVTGIGGAEVAELEGTVAGASAAAYLARGFGTSRTQRSVQRRLRRARRFARRLEQTYRVRPGWLTWLTEPTVMCRCEETTWGAVHTAVEAGAADLRAVKGTTRCGMGYCQGRICGPPLQVAVAENSGRPLAAVGDFHTRHIATPVPLSRLASSSEERE